MRVRQNKKGKKTKFHHVKRRWEGESERRFGRVSQWVHRDSSVGRVADEESRAMKLERNSLEKVNVCCFLGYRDR